MSLKYKSPNKTSQFSFTSSNKINTSVEKKLI